MNKFPAGRLPFLLLYVMMTASPAAFALQATANGSLGVEYTDNATLAATDEVEDQLVTALVGGSLTKTGGSATANADFSLSRQQYLNDTFATRNYLSLGSFLNWEPLKNRLMINVQDHYSQTAIDNLAANVPSNRQNTNAFSLGANFSYPLASRHSLSISPSFSDYRYSESDTDNQQFDLSAGWFYQFRPTMQVSLSGGNSRVRYDSSTNTDYDSNNVSLGVSGTTARARYSASIGKTWVDRAALADNNAVSAGLSVDYDVSSRSTLKAYLSQDITNSSALFLGYAIDPATGDITNVQVSGEAVLNRSMRVNYARKGTTVNTDVWTEFRQLDYSSATPDRDVQEVGARLGYSVSPLINASLNGRFTRDDQAGADSAQKRLSIGAVLGYQLSRRMGVNFGVKHQSRNSTATADEYDELSVSASLGYKFWP